MSDASTQSIKENEKEREKKELVCLRKISEVWSIYSIWCEVWSIEKIDCKENGVRLDSVNAYLT